MWKCLDFMFAVVYVTWMNTAKSEGYRWCLFWMWYHRSSLKIWMTFTPLCRISSQTSKMLSKLAVLGGIYVYICHYLCKSMCFQQSSVWLLKLITWLNCTYMVMVHMYIARGMCWKKLELCLHNHLYIKRHFENKTIIAFSNLFDKHAWVKFLNEPCWYFTLKWIFLEKYNFK